MLSKYISLPVFLISFAFGLFCIYVVGPEVKTLAVYPSPANFDKMLFKDTMGQCFEYTPVEVDCPLNPKTVPVQK
jgi:hypothetical protein